MIRFKFLKSGGYLEYTTQWTWHSATLQKEPLVEVEPVLPIVDIINAAMSITSFWYVAQSKSKLTPVLPPVITPPKWPVAMGFDLEHDTRYPTFYRGQPITYDSCAVVEVTPDYIKDLFLSVVTKEIPMSPLYNEYIPTLVPAGVTVVANVTRHTLTYEGGKWAVVENVNPAWEEHKTRYGFTVYTTGKVSDIPISDGISTLANMVASQYSSDLIENVPQSVFTMRDDLNEYEKLYNFRTNAMRIFYVLNAEFEMPKEEPVVETAPVVEHQHSAETICNIGEGGEKVACGSSVDVLNGAGTWTLFELSRLMKSCYRAYTHHAESSRNTKRLSPYAISKYTEMFSGARRIPSAKVKPDTEVRIQVITPTGSYVWCGTTFRAMFGSEHEYQNKETVNQDLAIAYSNGEVTLTDEYLTHMMSVFLSYFYEVTEATAQLYYQENPLPDAQAEYYGEIVISDPRTLKAATYKGDGEWEVSDVSGYPAGVSSSMFGFVFSCVGSGTIYSRILADIVASSPKAIRMLSEARVEAKDEIAKNTIFGNYETLHTCALVESLTRKPDVTPGFDVEPEVPVAIRVGGKLAVWTDAGWRWYKGQLEASPIASVAGVEVCWLEGSCDFDYHIPSMLCGFSEYTADLSDEVTKLTIELEGAIQ